MTAVQAAPLPLNSTLYLPRLRAIIAASKTRIVLYTGIFMDGPTFPSPPIMPDHSPFHYGRKVQTETLPQTDNSRQHVMHRRTLRRCVYFLPERRAPSAGGWCRCSCAPGTR